MQITSIFLITALFFSAGCAIFFYTRLRSEKLRLSERDQHIQHLTSQLTAAQQDVLELSKQQAQLQNQVDNKQLLKTEFQNLAQQIFEEKNQQFDKSSQASLESLLKPFREQIEGFQKRVNDVHSESLQGHVGLSVAIAQVRDMGIKISEEAHNLTRALKGDKKLTGSWGEMQLENTLQQVGLVRGEHYEQEKPLRDTQGQLKRPDFIVKLPDNKHIVIDCKMSLVDYDRAIAASNEAEWSQAIDDHVKAIRAHIDSLGSKEYSHLLGINSPSFVLMFLPIEPAYIEAMKHNKELFNYGAQRQVILVSHTTLMPILKTVAHLWMLERSNQEAKEISEKAGDIYQQVCRVAEHLSKLGGSFKTVTDHYNKTVSALAGKQGLYGKVERFNLLSAKASKELPALEPLLVETEESRLQLID
jgi:DNA recombination protein RmuC